MPGPCSLPNGNKTEWLNLNEILCGLHEGCTPAHRKMSKDGEELTHDFITRRIWLMNRNRLVTGKTV